MIKDKKEYVFYIIDWRNHGSPLTRAYKEDEEKFYQEFIVNRKEKISENGKYRFNIYKLLTKKDLGYSVKIVLERF